MRSTVFGYENEKSTDAVVGRIRASCLRFVLRRLVNPTGWLFMSAVCRCPRRLQIYSELSE